MLSYSRIRPFAGMHPVVLHLDAVPHFLALELLALAWVSGNVVLPCGQHK